ncbi:RNA polymerase sigma-70 factor [Sphingobacterium phlebotomi]|uniref:RNA polymerase sigma-70 factor n=1 Tax=Sphingobacterium phlebotomi TaxID=2605433 RepID=A0A5D4HDL3_9SPHI|nr:RNA polymerase sigma-70 factor [Sphingobacterium phlebotomi]TYR38462.1 RNA polymerase sigma-70 factor [Sphingobacterium phlebotomi]
MKNTKLSDSTLIEMLLSPNMELKAFDILFFRYSEGVFGFILSVSKDYYIAEEVVQNVFILLWKKRSLLDKTRSLKSLLFSMAHNEMISLFRKQKSEFTKRENFYAAFPSEISDHTEYEIEFKNLRELLDKVIDILPEKRQEIYRLSKEQGLSNKEISERLSISVKTVENQMTAARRTLRKYISLLE